MLNLWTELRRIFESEGVYSETYRLCLREDAVGEVLFAMLIPPPNELLIPNGKEFFLFFLTSGDTHRDITVGSILLLGLRVSGVTPFN